MLRSKLQPDCIERIRRMLKDADKSVAITRAEYTDLYTTIIRDEMRAAAKSGSSESGLIVMMIGGKLFADLEHILFDDEPEDAGETDTPATK